MIERKEGAMQMILRGREKADVAIAGGGLSGITIALWLRRAGLNAALLEAETPGCGASGRCGGLLSPCTHLLCAQLECKRGPNAVGSYMQSRMKALRSVVDLGRRHGLEFGLREMGEGVILSENAEALSREMNALQRAGVCVRMDAQHHGGPALCFSPVYALDAQEYLRVLFL